MACERLKLVPHARQRLYERYGKELSNRLLAEMNFRRVSRQSHSRTLCKFIGENIYFILRRSDNKIITFLTEEQAKDSFGI